MNKSKHFGHGPPPPVFDPNHQHGPGCGCQMVRPPWYIIAFILVRFVLPLMIRRRVNQAVSAFQCFCLNTVAWIRVKVDNPKVESCWDCTNHYVVSDPHPIDKWRGKDKALLCKLQPPTVPVLPDRVKPPKMRFNHRIVACACRNVEDMRKESKTPEWCPLRSSNG